MTWLPDPTAGATPLDFAYALHTDLGHRCRGAKVDGHMATLDTPLASGQRVHGVGDAFDRLVQQAQEVIGRVGGRRAGGGALGRFVGEPLKLDDPKMIAIEAYVAYERRGVAMAPGKH